MLIRLLGVLDLVSAAVLLLLHYDVVGWRFALSFALYLMAKGYAFKDWFVSWIDFIAGLYFFALFFFPHTILTYAFAAYLGYKGIMSLL